MEVFLGCHEIIMVLMKRSVMLEVKAKVPTRVDLMGGTLDLWPIHQLLERKGTINVGIGIHAKVSLAETKDKTFTIKSVDQSITETGTFESICNSKKLPLIGLILNVFWDSSLPSLSLELEAESPKGAGLGGSSALAICLGAALNKASSILGKSHKELDDYELIRKVQDIEAKLLFMPVGCQDYIGALRGRMNYISYPCGSVCIETQNPDKFSGMESEMIVCYSGKSRFSGMNNWELFKKFCDKDQDTLKRFKQLGDISHEGKLAFNNFDWNQIRSLSKQDWDVRKQLCPGIETEETKSIDIASLEHGAYFSRVCGAGGGGVMAIFAPEDKHQVIKEAVTKVGAVILPAQISNYGLMIECG